MSADDDRRSVFLVHGRDLAARDAVAQLLKAFDLKVVNWTAASAATKKGTPQTLEIVKAGLDLASAVVVLFTPDDIGRLQDKFLEAHDGAHERVLTGQARQNVILEAGMALALNQDKTVIVEIGAVRDISDIQGMNRIRLTDSIESRRGFGTRLQNTGLTADMDGDDWRTAGDLDPKV